MRLLRIVSNTDHADSDCPKRQSRTRCPPAGSWTAHHCVNIPYHTVLTYRIILCDLSSYVYDVLHSATLPRQQTLPALGIEQINFVVT